MPSIGLPPVLVRRRSASSIALVPLTTFALFSVAALGAGCLPGSGGDFYDDGGTSGPGSGGSGGSSKPPADGGFGGSGGSGGGGDVDGSVPPEDDAGPPGPCDPGRSETGKCGRCGTRVRICGSGGSWSEWSKCSGESGICTPKQTRSSKCGSRCGTRTETCSASCNWSVGACTEGACSPGAKDTSSAGCGAGETKTRTCSSACSWGPFTDCMGGACTPGDSESGMCGKCGTRSRSCTGSGSWGDWGACGGETGDCSPGDGRTASCGMCGRRTETCSASCAWSPGVCTGEGACTPGKVESTSSGCFTFGTTRSRTCSSFCSWGAYGPCTATPPPTGACADGGAGETLGANMVGCPGRVSWTNRDTLCAPGWSTCSVTKWTTLRTKAPGYHYWVDEELKGDGREGRCTASLTGMNFCPLGQPMRVCTTSKKDLKGNTCVWINCGYNTPTPNQYFGGCNGTDSTAGTLCCSE